MVSPVIAYFAGIGTVVAAIGIGFSGGLLLSSTTPVNKEPAAAFAKRSEPKVEPVVVTEGTALLTPARPVAPVEEAPASSVPRLQTEAQPTEAALAFKPVATQPVTREIEENSARSERRAERRDAEFKNRHAEKRAAQKEWAERRAEQRADQKKDALERRKAQQKKLIAERRTKAKPAEPKKQLDDDDEREMEAQAYAPVRRSGPFGLLFPD